MSAGPSSSSTFVSSSAGIFRLSGTRRRSRSKGLMDGNDGDVVSKESLAEDRGRLSGVLANDLLVRDCTRSEKEIF